MPLYEYQCQACGHQLEALQSLQDSPLVDCPACNKPELKKLISAPGFRLKGQGWYETDFKRDKKRNLHEAKAGAADATNSDSAKDKPSSAKTDAASTNSATETPASTSSSAGGSATSTAD